MDRRERLAGCLAPLFPSGPRVLHDEAPEDEDVSWAGFENVKEKGEARGGVWPGTYGSAKRLGVR